MEERLQHDNVAEVALSAMVSMIMILLFSAIVAGMALMMIEQAFMQSKSQSIEQSETLNSIPMVLAFEVESFDDTGNTNDQLYMMFKFPYASKDIPDVNVKWAMMCDIMDIDPGSVNNKVAHTLVYASGDFDAATEFPGTYYHIIIDVDDPTRVPNDPPVECDLVEDMSATLVLAVENGRTTELDFYIPTDVRAGHDLMS
jgi:hypothetical protein